MSSKLFHFSSVVTTLGLMPESAVCVARRAARGQRIAAAPGHQRTRGRRRERRAARQAHELAPPQVEVFVGDLGRPDVGARLMSMINLSKP